MTYGRVFAAMVREEFRMHSELFGGRRFVAFPLVIGALASGTVWLVVGTGTPVGTAVAGLHVLVFLFGMHTGSIGLVGQDAMRNAVGGMTLLVFSARTLPLSGRRLLGVFLVKDAVYYSALFLSPLSLAFLAGGLGPAVALLWLSTAATFVFGVTVTFTGISLSTRGKPGGVILLALAAAVGLGIVAGVDVAAWTPYALYLAPGLRSFVVAVVPSVVLAGAAMAIVDTGYERPARTGRDGYERWLGRLPRHDPVAAKTLLEVARSEGGLWKAPFSAGVLFLVTVGLMDLATRLTGIQPSIGVSMGAVLALSAFTSYNWLTQFDDLGEYLRYPLDVPEVFRAKAIAFVALGPATGLAYLALATVWPGARPLEALVGALLLCGVQGYLFGLTVYLAGFSPNEFLFDTVLFLAFSVAVAVVLVPVLIVGLVLTPVPATLLAGLSVLAVVAGALGVVLYRRAVPRWTAKARTGDV